MKSSSRKVRLSRFNRGIDWVDPGCGLQLGGFIPTALVIPFLSLDFFTHEISEWAYERTNGVQGSSALFGLLVDTTANVGQIGLYVLKQSKQSRTPLYPVSPLIRPLRDFVREKIKAEKRD